MPKWPEVDPAMKILRLVARDVPKALTLVAFGFLCVLVGIASARFEFFPYPLVRDAWLGAQAARIMLLGGDDDLDRDYAARRRFGQTGVTRYNPARAMDGHTLYSSSHAAEVLLVDMAGKVVRRWNLPFSEILAQSQTDREPVPDDEVSVRRAVLLPDGGLVAVYERPDRTPYGWGLAQFDPDGRLRWGVIEHLHHDFTFGPDGRLYTLGHEIRTEPRANLPPVQPPFFDEFLVILSPSGDVLERISIYEAFANSSFREALYRLADLNNPKGDYLHPNDVEVVDAQFAAKVPGWRSGQVLVSLREMDGLALIDPGAREVVWFMRGEWHRQHDPDLLANGHILLFDNQGDLAAGMRSQLLEVDPVSRAVVWRFRSTDTESFYTETMGSQQPLGNGNILVTESLEGRMFEITRSGQVVWEYLSPAEEDGHRAFVMGAQRLPAGSLTFLDGRSQIPARGLPRAASLPSGADGLDDR
jgi:Arylsulfotransferase (ASST)